MIKQPQLTSNSVATGRTIINNNNYCNNNNNNSYSLPSGEEQTLMGSSGSRLSSAPQNIPLALPQVLSERVVAAPAQETNVIVDNSIPQNWDYIKIDLFDNSTPEELAKGKTKLKIALNIKKAGQTHWNSFNAGLNSPIRNMKRNLDSATWNNEHYMIVREAHSELKKKYPDVRASKFYEKGYKGKGGTVEQLSVIVCQEEQIGHYLVSLIFGEDVWCWRMRGDKGFLTPTQRKKNIIATVGIRPGNKVKNKNAKDLL
jgi:hypothetical protein